MVIATERTDRSVDRKKEKSNQAGSRMAGLDNPLTDAEFETFRKLIRDLTGIHMDDAKRQLVYRRVSGRLKATGTADFASYLKRLEDGDQEELENFCNAITTNLTSFFREVHHFEFLKNQIIPAFKERRQQADNRLRIWSAGCSTGEEPYSIAMTIRESLPDVDNRDVKVLCTDLDSDVLNTARIGIYSGNRLRGISNERLRRWFLKRRDSNGDEVKARDELRRLLSFKRLNLMSNWPMKSKFDLIFCRNVMIYFDKPTQKTLVERFANVLNENGYLIIGHSESMSHFENPFRIVGQTIYQRDD